MGPRIREDKGRDGWGVGDDRFFTPLRYVQNDMGGVLCYVQNDMWGALRYGRSGMWAGAALWSEWHVGGRCAMVGMTCGWALRYGRSDNWVEGEGILGIGSGWFPGRHMKVGVWWRRW